MRRTAKAAGRLRGFTLLEMLIVMAVLGLLAGLLLMGVQFTRQAARRTQCLNNQQQISRAMLSYVHLKDKFPPGFSAQPKLPPASARSVGWVPPVLPYLEERELHEMFLNNQWLSLSTAEVSLLVCPSRSSTGSPAPLSYVVNCGLPDNYRPAAGTPMDWKQNGVFFNQFSPVGTPSGGQMTTDLNYIGRRDGTSATIMFSENLDALDWISVASSTPRYAPYPLPKLRPLRQNNCWWQGIVWVPTEPSPRLNYGAGSVPINAATDDDYARPSSAHAGGFIVTMCDGHSRYLDEALEYRVYATLMAPDSTEARLPGSLARVTYPSSWTIGNTLAPVTAEDLGP